MKINAIRGLALTALLCCSFAIVVAQEHGATASSTAQSSQQSASPASQPPDTQRQEPRNPNSVSGGELSEESREIEHEENGQFKYSTTMRWFARHLGLSTRAMYWLSMVVNFGLLVLFFYMLLRSKLPQAFRDRTAAIHKGIKEAQAASADAARRLSDIETRLAKLNSEVAEIRASAEHDAAAEEERIRQAAEEDKKKVVEAAETEISAFARNARRELKSYAASLAVDLASRKIQVDDSTDQALVREFVEQLGKDGR